MSVESKNVREIFLHAVDLSSPRDRAAYVQEACAGDDGVRMRVEALIFAHDRPESLLDRAAVEANAEEEVAATIVQPIAEQPGTVIGPYKLLQVIGEGGMGVVYMAEQSEPVSRRVALKIIKPGMDTGQVIARFEAERQALAMMDHPNIAKVLDAGATESGHPYFAMELVKGIPISDYCDEQHFTPKERLELFVTVCKAVQHAHQKGIIHRDLKPSNVLVAEYDHQAVPKIIDFGVAKATSQKLTEKTMFTEYGQIVGTLEYMSPEQAKLNQLDIDTRSDVYSLGVLLYHLLTGTTPFERERPQSAAFEEMLRIIRDEEPPKPSTRISILGKSAVSLSGHRRTNPRQLHHFVRGELDWIVMRALEKDRSRRYESATTFSTDIERFLDGKAVEAGPPSKVYRMRKFVRRHWAAVGVASALLLALCVGLAGTTMGLIVVASARDAESEAKTEAQRRREEAESQREIAREKRREADEQRQIAEDRAETIRQNLYYAEMNLAGQAAQTPSGIARVKDLLANWRHNRGSRDLRKWEWYYLDSLCRRDLFTLRGHRETVLAVCWSPDGTQLASASEDQTVRVWDANTRAERFNLGGHTGPVTSVSWSPDGKRLASASGDETVKIWNAATGTLMFTLRGHTAVVISVCWSPDSKRVASGGEDAAVKIWNTDLGKEERTLDGHSAPVNAVSWSPDGNRLASAGGEVRPGGRDQTLRLWELATGNAEILGRYDGPVHAVAWSPDGTLLATDGGSGMRIWDVGAQTPMTKFATDGRFISWSPDGRRIATTGGPTRDIAIWDVDESWTPGGSGHTAAGVREITMSDIIDSTKAVKLRGHTDNVMAVAWSPDGARLATASMDNTLKVWDATTTDEATGLTAASGGFWSVCWSDDGSSIASGSRDGSIRVSSVGRSEPVILRGHPDTVLTLDWSRERLASAGWGGKIKLWNTATREETHEFDGHENGVWEVSWCPTNEKWLASAGRDNTVKIWEVDKSEPVRTLHGHTTPVTSVCWSPDGRRLASVSWGGTFGSAHADATLRVWDVGTGAEVLPPRHRKGFIRRVRWSLDGMWLATAGAGPDIDIWDASTIKRVDVLRGEVGQVPAISWSPNGGQLASASMGGTITIWDVITRRETVSLRLPNVTTRSICWSPNGMRLAVANTNELAPTSGNHNVTVWDATVGYEMERQRRRNEEADAED